MAGSTEKTLKLTSQGGPWHYTSRANAVNVILQMTQKRENACNFSNIRGKVYYFRLNIQFSP